MRNTALCASLQMRLAPTTGEFAKAGTSFNTPVKNYALPSVTSTSMCGTTTAGALTSCTATKVDLNKARCPL